MERRQIIIYALFVFAVGYGIYFHFLSDENNQAAKHEGRPLKELTAAAAQILILGVDNGAKAELPPNKNYDWGRNPFKNKIASVSRNKTAPVSHVRAARPRLTAISIDGPDTFVVVNSRVISTGENIGIWKFRKADKEKALFDGPNGPVWVQLGG